MAIAAETPTWSRRRRRLTWGRVARGSVPYLLILPVLGVIGAVLGYPLYNLVRLSFQRYGLFELIRHTGQSVGLKNYSSVLHDQVFWHTLLRTVVFAIVNVGLTMVLGTALALLLLRLSSWVRVLLMSGLVLVWSVPVVVAVQVWYWMTNYQNGVLNYVLTQLHLGDFFHHDWYATTFSQLGIVTALIVWGALPFVVITVYAGLAQVPRDLRRGGRDRRRDFSARLPRRDRADPHARAADPHEPLDHLGLRRLHTAVPADRPGAHEHVELRHGHVPVRGGLLQERLRARRGDLAADAGDRRIDERLLRAQDGQDG